MILSLRALSENVKLTSRNTLILFPWTKHTFKIHFSDVYSFNLHIIIQHLSNTFLNFHCEMLKIESVVGNFRRRLENDILWYSWLITRKNGNWNQTKKIKWISLREMFLEMWCENCSDFYNFKIFKIKMLCYADDAVLLANSEDDLQCLLYSFKN